MKTIIVLTDFSANATCAAEAALILSGKLRTNLLVFNTYINYATMSSYGGGAWIVDEFTTRKKNCKQGLELLTEGLEALSNQLEPGDYKPVINFDMNDCDLQMNIEDLLDKYDVELIVMGARSHGEENALYGHDTGSIINHATRPVLIVPSKTDLRQIRKVIFATNFDSRDFKAIHYLMKLGDLFHIQIEIIHVTASDLKENGQNLQAITFKQQLNQLAYQGLTYNELSGNDVISRLNQEIAETGPGLLALLHHQRSLFGRLFAHSETKKALIKQEIPLLVFPSKMT